MSGLGAANKARGALIVIEGLDRAGKSTQVSRIAQQINAKTIKFPERTTPIGKMINAYLGKMSEMDDRSIHLLFSANRWEKVDDILSSLNNGQHVICDRYAFSGIAYSCAKGLSHDWCRSPDVGLPLPDLTLFLSLTPEVAAQRGAYGEERYEVVAIQEKVKTILSQLGSETNVGPWQTIDAGQDIDKVTEDCLAEVKKAIDSVQAKGAPIGKLFT